MTERGGEDTDPGGGIDVSSSPADLGYAHGFSRPFSFQTMTQMFVLHSYKHIIKKQ